MGYTARLNNEEIFVRDNNTLHSTKDLKNLANLCNFKLCND